MVGEPVRVIGGKYRSRKLPAPPPDRTRPTSDRLRETVFNILGPRVIESMFLDVYAGVGAVGIEALSRGASGVVFVDRSWTACRSIRRNLEALGIGESNSVRVCRGELSEIGRTLGLAHAGLGFDIVFLDPPYERTDLYIRDLEYLGTQLPGSGWALAERGVVIAEHWRKTALPERLGRLRRDRVHPQGDSALSFYRLESEWKQNPSI